jgi:septal ring factor EnvC (AmiA/AmiB activator)
MTEQERSELEQKLAEKKATLAEREASVPAHSIRPHQLIEIEELEDEIAALEKKLAAGRSDE